MAELGIKIHVWPNGKWVRDNDVDDLEWYIESHELTDDYSSHFVPDGLDDDDIKELIELQALPGMLPEKGEEKEVPDKIVVAEGDIVIIHHSSDIDYDAVTILDDRLIVNAPDTVIEIIRAKK